MKRTRHRSMSADGFSIVELLIALAVSLLVTSAVFAMLDPAGGAFQTALESADVEQRLRASSDALVRDVMSAGSRPSLVDSDPGAVAGVAALFPMRIGRRSPDPPGSFNPTRIAMWSVNPGAPQAVLASPVASADGTVQIEPGAGCTSTDPSCGFRAGTTAIVLGPHGAWDLFSVTAISGSTLTLEHNLPDSSVIFPVKRAVIAESVVRTYFLGRDRTTGIPQLLRYDGTRNADVPVIDHIVDAQFEWLGDAQPPMPVPSTDPSLQARVTYGPSPPALSSRETTYAAGENCAFARDADARVMGRLGAMASGAVLVRLSAADLTDGPWCPDAASPSRYDADLLRVREVRITLRAEAALPSLRGPAGLLFTYAGTARGTRVVPDRTIRLSIAPRALGLSR